MPSGACMVAVKSADAPSRRCLLHQSVALQDVVDEGMPKHRYLDLQPPTNRQPDIPVAPPGVNALADRAEPVNGLPLLAAHPRAPSKHTGTVLPVRSVRISAVFGPDRRAVDSNVLT